MRIAQIGTSNAHAAATARALKSTAGIEFVGVYDPPGGVKIPRSGADAYEGVPRLSEREVLDDPSVQVVFVETWPLESLGWARRALEAGKHVSIDKPPGPDLAELRALADLAWRRGLHLQIGYFHRFSPDFEFARMAVREGLIGEILNIVAQNRTTLHNYETRRELDHYPGGIMFEIGSHYVDLVVALMGTPQRVTPFLRANYQPPGGKPPYIDNTTAVLEYERALVVVQAWAIETEPVPHRRFKIFGTRGAVRLDTAHPPKAHLYLVEPAGPYRAGWQPIALPERPREAGYLAEFLAVVRGERAPTYGTDHELAVHATLLQACGAGG